MIPQPTAGGASSVYLPLASGDGRLGTAEAGWPLEFSRRCRPGPACRGPAAGCGMKRQVGIWATRLAVAGIIWQPASPVWAEAVGSPSSILKKGKWVMGLASSFVPSRSMKGDAEATVYGGGHSRGYGLTDWLSVYGKIGGAFIEVDDPSIKKKKAVDPSTKHSFGANVLASLQVKARLLQHQRTGVEWDGSIQYVDMRAGHKDKNEGRWHEWQFATSIAKAFGRVKPYVGAKLSIVDFSYKVREEGVLLRHDKYEEDSPLGLFVGTDVYLGQHEDVILNVETGYVDGADIAVSIGYLF